MGPVTPPHPNHRRVFYNTRTAGEPTNHQQGQMTTENHGTNPTPTEAKKLLVGWGDGCKSCYGRGGAPPPRAKGEGGRKATKGHPFVFSFFFLLFLS